MVELPEFAFMAMSLRSLRHLTLPEQCFENSPVDSHEKTEGQHKKCPENLEQQGFHALFGFLFQFCFFDFNSFVNNFFSDFTLHDIYLRLKKLISVHVYIL